MTISAADRPRAVWSTAGAVLTRGTHVWSHRVVGYSIDSRMKSRRAVAALDNAAARRGVLEGCILHTDCGSQFRSRKLVRALNRNRMAGAMGRVGAAGDNAAMESFFGLLQNKVLNRRSWASREQLRIAIVVWIERTYHRRRRQRSLARLTPWNSKPSCPRPARPRDYPCHLRVQQTPVR